MFFNILKNCLILLSINYFTVYLFSYLFTNKFHKLIHCFRRFSVIPMHSIVVIYQFKKMSPTKHWMHFVICLFCKFKIYLVAIRSRCFDNREYRKPQKQVVSGLPKYQQQDEKNLLMLRANHLSNYREQLLYL